MPQTTCFDVFEQCVLAVQAGELIESVSAKDKEFHFQNWFEKRLQTLALHYEGAGRNTYPDFSLVECAEGYEVKGLAWPGRERDYDSNSQVPTGYHNGRQIFYVFGRYPADLSGYSELSGRRQYPVVDLVVCHGDFLNADHHYEHKNKNVKGFGTFGDIMIRDRKMYVAPTPFALTEGTTGLMTLIVPEGFKADARFQEVGRLSRVESDTLVVGYSFDLRANALTAERIPNPGAGTERKFIAYRFGKSGFKTCLNGGYGRMNTTAHTVPFLSTSETTAIEGDFPIVEISQIAEQESWRKEINRPIYHIHKWWATRLGSVFRGITLAALSEPGTDVWQSFYKYHQLSGKVVLDPFMGSGTTLGEATKLGAKAIGCDINPVSTFQVRQAFTRVPEPELRAAFARLEQQVAPEIRRYYQTRAPSSGELIPVLYYFWVKTVTTPENETIPLFSRYVFSQDAYPKKKPKAQLVCPACWEVMENHHDATEVVCPHCAQPFNPQQGPAAGQYVTATNGKRYRIKDLLPADKPLAQRMYAMMALRPNGEKIYLPVRDEDQALYAEAETRLEQEELPLPTLSVRSGHNTDQALGYNYRHWRDFFNARQLLCLGLLLRRILEIEDVAVQEQMLCLFSGTLEFNNMFCSFKGEGTGAVRHMFSHHILKPERAPLENSVWGTDKSSGTFSTLFESRLLRAKRYLDEPFEVDFQRTLFGERLGAIKTIASYPIDVQRVDSWEQFKAAGNAIMVLNGDSAALPIPAKSVDAVVTDPPYFDFVHYSELSDFFFAWLSPVLKGCYAWFERADSSAPGEVQHKDSRVFAHQLAAVFTECQRVLKDDGVLAFSFHHSRVEGWAAIYEAITSAGLVVVAAHPVHAELRAASPKAAAKEPISLDAILICKKRSVADVYMDEKSAIANTRTLVKRLENAGMSISTTDHFVITASQMLIVLSSQTLNFDAVCNALQKVSKHTHNLHVVHEKKRIPADML